MPTIQEADENYAKHNGSHTVIPEGMYCYKLVAVEKRAEEGTPIMKTQRCPYWAINPEKDDQNNGYCALLEVSAGNGYDENMSLLWDQVKECGINKHLNEEDVGLG